MATSYRYQQNDFEGATVGYVRYNISPDLGQPVAPGETITVTGQAYHRRYAHACIELSLTVNGRTWFAHVNQSVPKGRSTAFNLAYTIPAEMAEAITAGRTAQATLEFTLWRGANASGTGDMMLTPTAQQALILGYRLEPVIGMARFSRCREADGDYERHDEGLYALADGLQLSISAAARAADVTVHTLTYADEDGESHTVDVDPALLLAGYEESRPALLAGVRFLLGRDYPLTLTLGDAWDRVQATVILPRAYTNFHQSGAARGGAAFGMFSGSTDSTARLESAYPIYGYDGVFGADGVRLDGVSELVVDSFSAQFTAYDAADPPRVTRTGRLVQIFGAVTPRVALDGSTVEQLIFTLPRTYWPRTGVECLCQGTGASVWLLHISADGLVTMSRYRSGNAYARAEPGNWLLMSATWIASDYGGPALVRRPARKMRANSFQGCQASASSTYSGNYPAWKAFDFTETTGWASLSSDGHPWLQLRMDLALKNIAVQVYARDTAYIENPTAGRILGSNNGSDWTELGTFSGWNPGQSGGLLGEVVCEHKTAYRYVRLEVTGRSHASAYVAVGYMVVQGEVTGE